MCCIKHGEKAGRTLTLSQPRTQSALSDLKRGNVPVTIEEFTRVARMLNRELAYFTYFNGKDFA